MGPGEQSRAFPLLGVEKVAVAAGMAAIALISGANTLTRYLTDVSLAFTEDFSVALIVIVTMLGASLAVARNRHLHVTYFVGLLSARPRTWFAIATLALTIVCFAILVTQGARQTYDEYRFQILLPGGTALPQWWFSIWMPVFSVLVILRAAQRIWFLARRSRP